MKKIYFGFSRSSIKVPLFSWLIMAVERTKFSHCYIKFWEEDIDGWMYYQASHTLVNCMSERVFLDEEIIFEEFEFIISDEAFAKVKRFMLENMGKPYGTRSILGYGWMQICSWFGLKVKNPFGDGAKTWVCSEFAAAALSDISASSLSVRPDDLTPKGLYELMRLLPKRLT